jgi:hypothetical protein
MYILFKGLLPGKMLGSFQVYDLNVKVTVASGVTLVVVAHLPDHTSLLLAAVRVDQRGSATFQWSTWDEFKQLLRRHRSLKHHVACRAELLWQHVAFGYPIDERLGVTVDLELPVTAPIPVQAEMMQLELAGAAE